MPTHQDRVKAKARISKLRAELAYEEAALRAAKTDLAANPGSASAAQAAEAAARDVAALYETLSKLRDVVLEDNSGRPASGAEMADRRYPLALLPIRLETRFVDQGRKLLIRIYPDTIHVNSHEPALSAHERASYETYWKELTFCSDHNDHLDLWRRLVGAVGAMRALHIATAPDGMRLGQRGAGWASRPVAAALPDRFVAHLWTSPTDGLAPAPADYVVLAPAKTREPLPIGPDLSGDGSTPLGPEAAWLHDFDAALKAGMAIVVDFGAQAPAMIHRLIVTGLCATAGPADQAQAFEALLAAHERSIGLEIALPQDATNALPGERPLYLSTPDTDALFDQRIAGPLLPYRRQASRHLATGPAPTAAFRIGHALGISPETLGYTARANAKEEPAAARILRRLLRLAVEPQLLETFAPGIAPTEISAALDLYDADTPDPLWDPLPHLMIGAEPYGILPVIPLREKPQTPLDPLLRFLRLGPFAEALGSVPRVGTLAPAAGAETLLALLRSAPGMTDLRLRRAVLITSAARLPSAITASLAADRQGAADLAAAAGADPSGMRALDYVFLDPSIPSTLPLTRPQSPGAPDVATWAGWLHEGLSPEEILNETYPGGARADCLLFHIARQCLLEALSDDIREAIAADPTMPAAYRQDAETAREKFTAGGPYWGNMQAMIYASMLAEPRGPNWAWVPDPAYRRARAVHEALGQLKSVASADLDGALSGAIALLSWRLDAWFTRNAAEALAVLRNDGALAPFGPDGYAIGLTLGAYGVVEGLSPRQRPQTAGHVLAPSPQHAAAAGVLLSADLADWLANHGSDYAIDLSSDRVRSALTLLEGIRAGQSLGALLGYRIERHLADGGGAQMIEPLRALAPTLANLLTPGTAPAELVAASTTLDGLKLLAKATAVGAAGPSAAALAPFAPSQPALLQEALTQAAAANDALSDLLLAESVYQLVQGNAARSQAASNLMAGVPAAPGEIEVTRLPETGIAVTHRLLLQIDVPAAATDWGASPRAAADPEAEAWAAAHLPAPAATVLTVETASGLQVMTLAELLREASNQARGSIAPGALDLLLLADTPVPAPGTFLSLLEEIAGGRIEPSSQGTGEVGRFGLAELWAAAHQLRACLTSFRPARPADLPRDLTANAGLGETRRAAAISALKDLITRLDAAAEAADLRAAIFSAALCGLGAGPGVEPERERQALRKEAEERVAQTYSGKDHSETLKALFGPLQPGLLPMQSTAAAPSSPAWQAVKVESTEVFAFLDKAARVRSKVASLNAALRSIDILGTGDGLIASVYQEGDPAAPWVGSESPRKAGGTGIITVSAPKVDLTSGSAVLVFVDEWTELFPAETLTGALAFHYDTPSSAPANVILLGLPRASSEGWSDADLADTAQEALSIARMRAIDPDLLTGLGQFLPAGFLRDGSVGGAALRSLTLPPAGAP